MHHHTVNLPPSTTTVPAAVKNLDLPSLPPKTKEEGELSSDADDEAEDNLESLNVQSTPAVVTGSVPLVRKSTLGVQDGSTNVQLQTTTQPTVQKDLKKNQLPPKSSPWIGHVGTDKNLVISFSDDDSGSDHETKGNTSRLDSSIKRTISSLGKVNKLKQTSLPKEVPKGSSLSRTFVSSMTKIPGSNSKGVGSMPLAQGSRARNFNLVNKNLVRTRDQGLVSNDNKLQDLRHQIALRESELKLKAAQHNKENVSVLSKDHSAMNPKKPVVMPSKSTPVSSGPAQFEPTEPARKRLKHSTSNGVSQAVESQQEVPAVKSLLPPKDSTLGNYYPQERNKVDRGQKEIPLCRAEPKSGISRRQPDNNLDNPLENMPRGDVNYGCNQTEKSSRLVNPGVASNQNAVPANRSSDTVSKSFEALSNAVLLNHNGNVNASEHTNVDFQSFFGMEELIDKELEEAQEHRHKCEIEERNALKAYLKAQRSLLEANARCTNLYHKRELYSAKVRSLILSSSGLSWPSGQHQHPDIELDYLPRLGYEMPTSSCQRLAEYNGINNPSFDFNNQGINKHQPHSPDLPSQTNMAAVTSAAVAIPSFTGLKASGPTKVSAAAVKVSVPQAPRFGIKASLKDLGAAVVATAASAVLASNAMALEVLLGSGDGSLVFVPSEFSVPSGEKIVFKNNAGFPHNVVFDEDEIPAGVDAVKISMPEEELLNAPGETYVVTLDTKGTYSFYCSPHQGAGMVGKVTVN